MTFFMRADENALKYLFLKTIFKVQFNKHAVNNQWQLSTTKTRALTSSCS